MGSFQSSDQESNPELRPLRVPMRREDLFGAVREMVADLDGWQELEADEAALVVRAERKGGLLGGTAKITIQVEGPEGIPSGSVTLTSESEGGLLSRDKSVVLEFMRPFARRVV